MSDAPGKNREKMWPVIVLAGLLLGLGGYVLWRMDTAPRTDDAYASADTIDVVPDVAGRIVELAVKDNQWVHQGDLLFRVDPRAFEDELTRASASLASLDAQIELARRTVVSEQYAADSALAKVDRARAAATQAADTLRRTEPLLVPGYVSAEDVSQARSAQRAAQAELVATRLQASQARAAVTSVEAMVAQREVILAEIALAQLHLEQTTVRAPFDGRVVSLKTTVGQYASALKPVFTLIDTGHWYVVANFRETDLKDIRPGTPAIVYLMGDTGRRFEGRVDSIGYGVAPDDGGFMEGGLPKVQRTLNWVRVAQRFPVKIRVEQADPELFRIGASAVALLAPQRGKGAGQAARPAAP